MQMEMMLPPMTRSEGNSVKKKNFVVDDGKKIMLNMACYMASESKD